MSVDSSPSAQREPSSATTSQVTLDDEPQGSNALNIILAAFLGFSLLALVIAVVIFTLDDPGKDLPGGLTSLASLIGGGLLAILNPVHAVRGTGRTRLPRVTNPLAGKAQPADTASK
jgi:hypothetical protein